MYRIPTIPTIALGLVSLVLLSNTGCVDDIDDIQALCEEFPEDCVDEDERAATVLPGSVQNGQYAYHLINKQAGYRYTICINVSSGDADLYGHYTGNPTTANYQYASANSGLKSDCIAFDVNSNGPYYVGIYGYGQGTSHYSYRVTASPKTSTPAALSEQLNWPIDSCKSVTSAKYGPFNSPWGNATAGSNPFFPPTNGQSHENYLHSGTDIACPVNTQVYAACAGPVKAVGWLGTESVNNVSYDWGYYLVQECVINGSTITVVYDHLKAAGRPAVNSQLTKNSVVGTLFDLTYPGEADHLHFGICRGNYATCQTNATYKAVSGAMPDTQFSGLMMDPHNPSLYSDVVSF